MYDFANKVALITGASAGIGYEFSVQLHELGARVLLVARREDLLLALAEKLNLERKDSAEVIRCDLTVPEEIQGLSARIKETEIDILINNAGRGSFGYFDELSLASEIGMVRLNVEAQMVLSHAISPQMKSRGSGVMVNVSSIAGLQPIPFMSTYSATKAFDLFHSLGLRNELRSFGIRVVAVCPGPVETEFGGVARVPGTATGMKRSTSHDVVRSSIQGIRKNKAIVVPGLRSKLISIAPRLVPLSLSSWLVGASLWNVLNRVRKKLWI